MAEILLKNITKKWDDFYGAKDINLKIKDKEFLVLLGPSGCGKTTTMRMVAGLEEPSSGEIYIDNKLVNNLEPRDRDVAMVFQNYGLYAHLSVYENIRFPLRVRKIDKKTHHQKVIEAAKLVELDTFLQRKPRELSGGQKQRVALARAIVREPNCFLMDEPLSNLDAKLRVIMRSEIKRLQQMLKVTTIYVTHDQIEAMTMADKVAILNKGEIVQVGTPQEIYDRPQNIFVAGFIGSPPMNLIQGEIQGQFFQSKGVKIKLAKKMKAQKVYLGIRAEDLKLSTRSNAHFAEKLYSVEKLGNLTLVYIKINNTIIKATADKNFNQKIGSLVFLRGNLASFLFYDLNTKNIL